MESPDIPSASPPVSNDQTVPLPGPLAADKMLSRENRMKGSIFYSEMTNRHSLHRQAVQTNKTRQESLLIPPLAAPADTIWPTAGHSSSVTDKPPILRQVPVGSAEERPLYREPPVPESTTQHRLPGGADKWQVIVKTIEDRIIREVADAVKRAKPAGSTQQNAVSPPAGKPAQVEMDPGSDQTALQLLKKMRRLERRERFRMGLLR